MSLRCALLTIFCFVFPSASKAAGQTYANQNYFYEINVPFGEIQITNAPPAPQHGFDIQLAPNREISVDASYDAVMLGSAEAALHDRASDDQISADVPITATAIAGLRASCVLARVKDAEIVLVTAYRGQNDGSAIIYTFELETDFKHVTEDKQIFDAMVKSFRTTSMSN